MDHLNADVQDTRMRIFLTAAQLFAEHGFSRVSVRQICEACGIQKPTLYYYFRDKENLLREMLQYTARLVEETSEQFVYNKEDFFAQVDGMIEGRKYFAEKYPQFIRFHAMTHFFSLPEDLRKEMKEKLQQLLQRFRELFLRAQQQGFIDADTDIDILMQAIVGHLNQMTLRYVLFNDTEVFSQPYIERLRRFWYRHYFCKGGKDA